MIDSENNFVTERIFDGLVQTIQREMAKLYQQNLEMKDEIATLKAEVYKHRQFLPMPIDMEEK